MKMWNYSVINQQPSNYLTMFIMTHLIKLDLRADILSRLNNSYNS